MLTAGQAQAIVVDVSGQQWNVTTFAGSYNENICKFATAANGGVMPWCNDTDVAKQFANAIGDQLGLPNFEFERPATPLFAPLFGTGPIYVEPWGDRRILVRYEAFRFGQGIVFGHVEVSNSVVTWAQATRVEAHVPGPLPILGLAAAFGFSRKLRKRIKLHRDTSAFSTSPGA